MPSRIIHLKIRINTIYIEIRLLIFVLTLTFLFLLPLFFKLFLFQFLVLLRVNSRYLNYLFIILISTPGYDPHFAILRGAILYVLGFILFIDFNKFTSKYETHWLLFRGCILVSLHKVFIFNRFKNVFFIILRPKDWKHNLV